MEIIGGLLVVGGLFWLVFHLTGARLSGRRMNWLELILLWVLGRLVVLALLTRGLVRLLGRLLWKPISSLERSLNHPYNMAWPGAVGSHHGPILQTVCRAADWLTGDRCHDR
jgi:hypothetical protein